MTSITIDFSNEKRGAHDDFVEFLNGSSVAAAQLRVRLGFLRKVFGILSVQLLFTTLLGAVFLLTPGLKGLVQQWSWMVLVGFILSIGLLIAMMVQRHSYPANYILLSAWTAVQAYTVGVVVSFYDQVTVLEAFLLTTTVVIALTIYTFQSKRDFTGWGPGLFAVVWVLLIGGIMQMFLMSETMEFLLAIGGAILFSLFIIYDLQMIMQKLSPEEYIMACINLYLDIINLFLSILRLINMAKKE